MKIGDVSVLDLVEKNQYFLKLPTFMNLIIRETDKPGSTELDKISKQL